MQVAGVPVVDLAKRIEEVRRSEFFRSQLSLKERELVEGTRSLLSSRALPMPELPMECPTCNHRWLDKCTRITWPNPARNLHTRYTFMRTVLSAVAHLAQMARTSARSASRHSPPATS